MLKKLKEEVERKGPQVVSEWPSCGFLENELSHFSTEGVTLAESVETLCDLITRVKKLGAKEKAKRRKRKVRFPGCQRRLNPSGKNHMKVGVKKLQRAGRMLARIW